MTHAEIRLAKSTRIREEREADGRELENELEEVAVAAAQVADSIEQKGKVNEYESSPLIDVAPELFPSWEISNRGQFGKNLFVNRCREVGREINETAPAIPGVKKTEYDAIVDGVRYEIKYARLLSDNIFMINQIRALQHWPMLGFACILPYDPCMKVYEADKNDFLNALGRGVGTFTCVGGLQVKDPLVKDWGDDWFRHAPALQITSMKLSELHEYGFEEIR